LANASDREHVLKLSEIKKLAEVCKHPHEMPDDVDVISLADWSLKLIDMVRRVYFLKDAEKFGIEMDLPMHEEGMECRE
jgi:hypothetical protein